MEFLKILTAALCVAVLHFSFRACLCFFAKRELAAMSARCCEDGIVIDAGEVVPEYAIRCALLVSNKRMTVTVRIPADVARRKGIIRDMEHFCERYPNLRYQII